MKLVSFLHKLTFVIFCILFLSCSKSNDLPEENEYEVTYEVIVKSKSENNVKIEFRNVNGELEYTSKGIMAYENFSMQEKFNVKRGFETFLKVKDSVFGEGEIQIRVMIKKLQNIVFEDIRVHNRNGYGYDLCITKKAQ
ncbi:hypothetical protein DS884_10050 [Tenacibaculum sp. E3R01]|uniref:hypothetical protein n=1 Tax=unclassified Tenacibaculum TaxID=2635139 RepID=UPI00089BE3B1|nr:MULTISPECIES: hypothetical protein [unclassified Tenacibaculum]RBW58196.1 hypothetical protein DS884_10050 [Tenacibaculum sp. E3R01]SED55614.1 hypothetical protein SAMN04487765_0346 [Tenacibaculum sp. MAR_2010_89]